MKKIININLSSRLIPIEDSAYEILRQYLDSLKRYFSQEDGADEIVSDIESRIAEIFQDKMRKGAHCITDVDVQEVKASMGTPEQFDEDTKANTGNDSAKQTQPGADPYMFARPRKRFYRDPEAKVLGGVCGGLGAYFNIDPLVFRIVFALLAIGGFGTGIVVYFIIWIATPEAFTAAEKLEMRGERVDVNNIKNTVQEEMNAFKSRMEGMGNDFKNFSQGRGKQFGRETGNAVNGFLIGLRNILVYVTKGIFIFFAVVVLLAIVSSLVVFAFFTKALLLKELIFAEGIQSFLFWPTVVLLIGVPIVSLVIFLLRKVTGIKQANKYAGMTLGFMWILGVIFCIWLVSAVVSDFSVGPVSSGKETFYLKQPSNNKLILRAEEDLVGVDISHVFNSVLRVADDTAIVNGIHIRLVKSETPDFQVTVEKLSRGGSTADAKRYISRINFDLKQQDSVLIIPNGIAIPRNSTFRGQQVEVTIRVPVGKNVEVERDAYDLFFWDRGRWRGDRISWDDFEDNDRVQLRMDHDGIDNLNREERRKADEKRVEEEKRNEEERIRREQQKTDSMKPDTDDNRYRYKRDQPTKVDTVRPDATAMTPVDNSDEPSRSQRGTLVAMETASFLFRMYRN